jgi:hypothetical protein
MKKNAVYTMLALFVVATLTTACPRREETIITDTAPDMTTTVHHDMTTDTMMHDTMMHDTTMTDTAMTGTDPGFTTTDPAFGTGTGTAPGTTPVP